MGRQEKQRQVLGPHLSRAWNLARGCCFRLAGVAHCFLCLRLKALEWSIGIFVTRVPSADNLADDPSREKYDLLEGPGSLGATRLEPYLCPFFEAAQTWQALSVLGRL